MSILTRNAKVVLFIESVAYGALSVFYGNALAVVTLATPVFAFLVPSVMLLESPFLLDAFTEVMHG